MRCDVPLSIHYYVLALSAEKCLLYEAFREHLVDIRNQGFPLEATGFPPLPDDQARLRALAHTVDEHFGHFYQRDPLRVVVVGEETLLSAFLAVTAHGHAVINGIEGDHTVTSSRDLGQIVWPVVKEAISGVQDDALRNLLVAAARGQMFCGLEAVARLADGGEPTTLLVEEGYHVRGSIVGRGRSLFISPHVDVRETMDDAVDVVIEKVLGFGGHVVFTPRGALDDRERIVLLRRDEAYA